MNPQRKKTILIDLDGVLNEYAGNFEYENIPKIKNGAKEFLENLSKDYCIKLFTTRNKIFASKWVIENKLEDCIEDITNIKELCWLYIDDRCINFSGDYKDLTEQIKTFAPWYRK